MNRVWRAGVLAAVVALGQGPVLAQTGSAAAGKENWQRRPSGAGPNQAAGTLWCINCHGANGEGGFGPDLAGRGLSLDQFRRAVRQPWGWMPRYPEKSVSEQQLADLTAWFASLPKVAQPGPWKTPLPAPAPRGPYVMASVGCHQCHGAGLGNPRRVLGGEFGKALDFTLFADVIYNHDQHYPGNQMGLFSRDRLGESTLREIYQYLFVDLGLRVPVSASLTGLVATGGATVVTLSLANDGEAGKGLVAQDLTVTLPLSGGLVATAGTGLGYKGVQKAAQAGGVDMAIWRVPSLGPGTRQTLTLTLSGAVTADQLKGSSVTWQKPALGPASPTRADSVAVNIPAPKPAPTR